MTNEKSLSKYWFELNACFHDLFRDTKFVRENIRGYDNWLRYREVNMTIVSFKSQFNIGDEELCDDIYCCVFERNDFYYSYKRRSIFFKYNDKVYMLKPDSGDWDINTGNLVLWCDVYEFDNELFNLSFNSIELYKEFKHPYRLAFIKSESDKRTYKLTLNDNTNIISEVIYRIKKENKARTNKKQEFNL